MHVFTTKAHHDDETDLEYVNLLHTKLLMYINRCILLVQGIVVRLLFGVFKLYRVNFKLMSLLEKVYAQFYASYIICISPSVLFRMMISLYKNLD